MPSVSGASWARGGLVVLAVLVALAPGVATGQVHTILGVGVVLAVATLAAAFLQGPAPRRSLVAVDTVYLILAAGSLLAAPPALTTVLLCVFPLVALVGLGACGAGSLAGQQSRGCTGAVACADPRSCSFWRACSWRRPL